jgi:hypothetical protein
MSLLNASIVPALLSVAASATPKPPAAPRAGAPLTRRDLMASQRELRVLHSMTLYSSGRRVWSIITIEFDSSFQSMVLIISIRIKDKP